MVFRQSDERAIPVVTKWLESHKPDLVIGNFVWEAIQSLGWRVPEEIAFATFDRSAEFPDHAGLDQRYEIVGRVAADVLITEITHNRRGIPKDPVQHAIKGAWSPGPSAPGRK
jgi:LacI family transcriptional regulator